MPKQKDGAVDEQVPEVKAEDTVVQRGAYLAMVEKSKDTVKKYGETTFEGFMAKIGSDGGFAQKVVADLLGDDKSFSVGLHPDSPQENNITGKLDNTGDVAVKQKVEGQSEAVSEVKS